MSTLEDQAAERKARLAALRNKRKQPEDVSTEVINKKPTIEKTEFELKSRNFNLETREEIKGFEKPPTTLDENSETVEALTQKIQDDILSKFEKLANEINNEININKIKPKSIGWDMKRDIQEDLDLLEDKTDIVIKNIVKEKIKKLREENN